MKTSIPNLVLRLEGVAVLAAAAVAYGRLEFSWLRFALVFFLPDVVMLGYLAGNKVGASTYNLVHTYAVPLAVGGFMIAAKRPEMLWIPLIWSAHIGFDRVMGFGLKYASGFKDTHLQKV